MHTLRTIDVGDASGYTEAARLVASTEDEWRQLWARHSADEPVPHVDFARERVVAAFLGSNAPACSQVRLTDASTSAGETRIEVTTFRQTECIALETQPHHIAALPAIEGTVIFQERSVDGPPPDS